MPRLFQTLFGVTVEDAPVLSGQLPAEIREKQGKEEKDTGKHGDPLVESSQIARAS